MENKITSTTSEVDLRAMISQGEEARKELNRRHLDTSAIVDKRIKRLESMDEGMRKGAAFNLEELRFAARQRCVCGAGLAYPKNSSMHGSWYCSAILQAKAELGTTHSPPYPFAFYEIKSEDQPSANGATTRSS